MAVIIGSARHDEHGACYTGGASGDQLQTSKPDYKGEVSFQDFYVHSKGWYVSRPKSAAVANRIADRMIAACNNANLGYDQNNRNDINEYGIGTDTLTECDCSSLVRQCVVEATGVDPGDFTTANETDCLEATGLVDTKFKYTSSTVLYTGDILTTQTKGHTVIVTSGATRTSNTDSTDYGVRMATNFADKSDPFLAGTYVTTAPLNIRNGAGTSNTILTTVPEGTSVENIFGYYSVVNDVNWLYVKFDYDGTTYIGFASGRYLEKTSSNKLTVNGKINKKTLLFMQKFVATERDGFIDGQSSSEKKYWPAISSEVCSWSGGSSDVVRGWQKFLIDHGYSVGESGKDGELGKDTAKGLQTFLTDKGYYTGEIDGEFGTDSAKALQTWLNTYNWD